MLITEADSKAILAGSSVAVPRSWLISQVEQLATADIAYPIALKAQVSSGGRGKAGGIRRCSDAGEAAQAFKDVMSIRFGDEFPQSVLAESWLTIDRELYLSVVIDGQAGGFSVLYSATGGIDIEAGSPPLRVPVGRPEDFRAHRLRDALTDVEEDRNVRERVVSTARRLLRIAQARDCLTIEINPLCVLDTGQLVAADAKIVLDEAAAFRQADTARRLRHALLEAPEDKRDSERAGLMMVWLDGEIGLVSGGAGMTMAAMDAVASAGSAAACFLDVSGSPNSTGFATAFNILDRNPQVRGILVSMFGGGLQMDRVARTLISTLETRTATKPVVFRLNGTRSNEATSILKAAGYHNYATLEDAVTQVIREVKQTG